jgi:hypothetical protein
MVSVARRLFEDIVALIDSQIAARTDGTNLFRGQARPLASHVPIDCVFVRPLPGLRSETFLDGSQKGPQVRRPSAQIAVRGEKNSEDQSYADALEILELVHNSVATLGAGTYDWVMARESEPLGPAVTDGDATMWLVNVDAMIKE